MPISFPDHCSIFKGNENNFSFFRDSALWTLSTAIEASRVKTITMKNFFILESLRWIGWIMLESNLSVLAKLLRRLLFFAFTNSNEKYYSKKTYYKNSYAGHGMQITLRRCLFYSIIIGNINQNAYSAAIY